MIILKYCFNLSVY